MRKMEEHEPSSARESPASSRSLCCAPARAANEPITLSLLANDEEPEGLAEREVRARRMALIPGGAFGMGGDESVARVQDGELPVHTVKVRPFALDVCATTNREFADFVAATGYVTDAERSGGSFVFELLLPVSLLSAPAVASTPWWRRVEGASWRMPEGPRSHVEERWDHPVVHVSWHDASAFARWVGKRLPTEAEWEYAARGGFPRARFPWGNELVPDGVHRCNVWQGCFPHENTGEDGYVGTAPAASYPKNEFGLYNMVGNVWEWCSDWFDATYYQRSPYGNPRGPAYGEAKVMRGGSYLCHESYCARYRVGARSQNTPHSAAGNIGFRCAVNV